MSSVIGVDLGTSNSAVASFYEGKHQVIPNELGERLTPSVVAFGKGNKILVGSDAKAQMVINGSRTISSIKRLIGRKIFSPEVEKARSLIGYEIVEGDDQSVSVKIGDTYYSPQEISAFILRHMRFIARTYLGSEVNELVVTVPAYFNDNQRQATKDACKIAGLQTLRIINEPTAAALAYGFGKSKNERVAIYDLGGGTFDISVLQLKGEVFEVLATAGDTYLGGDDFDDRIIDLAADNFLKKTGVDLRKMAQTLPLLRVNAEKAKRKLSYAERTDLYIPGIIQRADEAIDLQFSLSRIQFQEACQDLIQRTFSVCDEALRNANLKASSLDAIILVGGSTKMSLIAEAVESYFGKTPLHDINPDEVVAVGASIHAHSLKGIATASPSAQIAKSREKEGLPETLESVISDPSNLKAAEPGSKVLLLDVTPLDLGIETVGGYTECMIESNSPIPLRVSKPFTTTKDDQETVRIRIFQGKNRKVADSTLLGEFEFSGFKKGKAGDVTVDVDFTINADGIVEVSARDKATGAKQSVNVKLAATMSNEKLASAQIESQNFQQVRLKNDLERATKVIICMVDPRGRPHYEEGYAKQLDPLVSELNLIDESPQKTEKKIDLSHASWLMAVDSFSNIPRFLQALTETPKSSPEGQSLFEFNLKSGEKIYALAKAPPPPKGGYWVEPYLQEDSIRAKIFLYSDRVVTAKPFEFVAPQTAEAKPTT